ncbi:hypothetical protein BC826DRAFT_1109865 [Russula brevipes]|nr:hypothetical protein BC826DRAFT_1109865 [Russula brevipes]
MVLRGSLPARRLSHCQKGQGQAARVESVDEDEAARVHLEVDKAPQPRTVETMCKTEWPAQGQPTETEVTVLTEQLKQATMEEAATRVLEGEAAREEAIVSPKGPRARADEDKAAHVHLDS